MRDGSGSIQSWPVQEKVQERDRRDSSNLRSESGADVGRASPVPMQMPRGEPTRSQESTTVCRDWARNNGECASCTSASCTARAHAVPHSRLHSCAMPVQIRRCAVRQRHQQLPAANAGKGVAGFRPAHASSHRRAQASVQKACARLPPQPSDCSAPPLRWRSNESPTLNRKQNVAPMCAAQKMCAAHAEAQLS